MKIAISQLEIIPSMPCDNTVSIISFISKAKKENADNGNETLLVVPVQNL